MGNSHRFRSSQRMPSLAYLPLRPLHVPMARSSLYIAQHRQDQSRLRRPHLLVPSMIRVLLVIAAAATVLVLPTAAGAHGGGWYWTRAAAENYIIDRTTISDDEAIA